jgi:hypothetical protein
MEQMLNLRSFHGCIGCDVLNFSWILCPLDLRTSVWVGRADWQQVNCCVRLQERIVRIRRWSIDCSNSER